MDSSMTGFPVLHYLPEFAETHAHCVNDAIQPSHPLPSLSPFAFNIFQHQGLFQWVDSSHQVARILELQLQQQYFQRVFRVGWIEIFFCLSQSIGFVGGLEVGNEEMRGIQDASYTFYPSDWLGGDGENLRGGEASWDTLKKTRHGDLDAFSWRPLLIIPGDIFQERVKNMNHWWLLSSWDQIIVPRKESLRGKTRAPDRWQRQASIWREHRGGRIAREGSEGAASEWRRKPGEYEL